LNGPEPVGVAVIVEELPAHMVDGEGLEVTVGIEFTVTVDEAEEEVHPFLSFTVIEYVCVLAGETLIEGVVTPVDQLYVKGDVPAGVADMVEELPAQIDDGVAAAVTVGRAFTITAIVVLGLSQFDVFVCDT